MTGQVKQQRETKLKVMESLQEEAYKGIIRIDAQTMREIGVRVGDVIEIEGGRVTVGIVDRAYPADIGQEIIRMDGIIRRNAKTGIGEYVKIRRADIKEAKAVTIAPAQHGIMIQADPEIFKNGLLGRAVVKGDQISLGGTGRRRTTLMGSPFEDIFDVFEQGFEGYGFGGLKFIVVNTNPKQAVIIAEGTDVIVSPHAVEISEEKVIDVTYEDIGGLEEEVKKIRELVELPLKYPEVFTRLGIQPPKGILLYGPPGTGKTLMAKAVANESGVNFIELKSSEFISALHGATEKRLKKIFEDAEANAPSIIFIDELDSIGFRREDRGINEFLNTPVMELLKLMDGKSGRGGVIVIGATNRIEALEPALRRPGRFDREVEIGVPDKRGRLNILKIHTRHMPLTKDVNLQNLANITHGFVGADLEALCKEAAMNVLRRVLPDIKFKENEPLSPNIFEKLKVTNQDFKEALKLVRPSAMREVLIETPTTTWGDIGGLEELKQELKEAVEWPLKHPDSFKTLGIRPPRGILLYGPPGTGKTLIAKAVANESEANFISVKAAELLSVWLSESEKGIIKLFERARQVAPCIIFFDEIDSLASSRGRHLGNDVIDRVVNQLLTEMDGLEELNDVVVIGATNRPDMVDAALLRPGRFDRALMVLPPDKSARLNILKIHTKGMPLKDVKLETLAEKTVNFTGADIEALCREAAVLALREDIKAKEVTMKHFTKALERVTSSITEEDIKRYKLIEESYLKTARGAAIRKQNVNYFG
ncbi:MAG: CDC48 family AAA ATPase [Nanoarchaeota archaeon]